MTLFEYLYTALTTQMMTGEIPYGAPLPSLRKLSALYHVGIRTVRDVMVQLKKDGYVVSQDRVGYKSAYRTPTAEEAPALLLSKWDAIMDIVKLMIYVLPEIFQNAVILAPASAETAWKAAGCNRRQTTSPKIRIRQNIQVHTAILQNYHNEYLDDLFRELCHFIDVPTVKNVTDPNEKIASIMQEHLAKILSQIEQQNYTQISYLFQTMYSEIGFTINHFFQELMRQYPEYRDYSSTQFRWQIQRGRQHRYIEIVRHLLQAVNTHPCLPDATLPSFQSLAGQYHVSMYTVSQAFALLYPTGLIEKNGRKHIVTVDHAAPIDLNQAPTALCQELLQYFCSLHLLALLCKSVSQLCYDSISIEKEENDDTNYREEFPNQIMSTMVKRQQISVLNHICEQLFAAAPWGIYFASAWKREWTEAQAGIAEEFCALWPHKQDQAASALQRAYIQLFQTVQAALMQCGCNTAGKIQLPLPITRGNYPAPGAEQP